MLATKTGIRRHGVAQQSYRSLIWLGRPANIASKLTDNANKPEESQQLIVLNACYDYGYGSVWSEEWPHLFAQNFIHNPYTGNMEPINKAFRRYAHGQKTVVTRVGTPPILMTKAAYDGLRSQHPGAAEVRNGWLKVIGINIPEYKGTVYDCDVIFTFFTSAKR
jgi:adenylate cyclase